MSELSLLYVGATSAKTDIEIPIWLRSFANIAELKSKCSISLKFGNKNISIATISSGKVKPIIDCLYPILGGKCGTPYDHLITELYVEKAVDGLADNQVRITIWQI